MSWRAGTIMLSDVILRGSRLWVAVGLATLGVAGGCGSGEIGGNSGGGGTSSAGQAGATGAAGTGSNTGAAGTTSQPGTAGTGSATGAAGTGSSAGTAGTGSSTGAAGTGSSTGAAGTTAGAAGTSAVGVKGVDVTSRDVAVDGKGTVFNVADDYFNDGFVPATPVANFGLHAQIITVVRDDGSLDVAWLDYVNGKSSPWNVKTPGAIYVTHIDPSLTTATTAATGLSTYKLLGFARDEAGAFYFAYNKDHALKSATQGNQNNLNGNELHVAKQTGGTTTWDTLIFGNTDNNADGTKGDPGGAASGVVGYDPTNKKVVIYLGHSMMWTPTRHQAGFLRLLDPATGTVIQPGGGDVIHFGAGWFYSHNFNQRLIIDGGDYYVLAHGDAYARQLGLAKWTLKNYMSKNAPDFDESYWAITGNQGDNNTNAQTGQFVRTKDGRFLMAHTTSQGRAARDVRLVLADGATGKAATAGAVWLTTNKAGVNATIAKVELLGDAALVTYALWDTTKKHQLDWYAALVDPASLAVVAPAKALTGVEFVDSAPLFRFKGGPNAGRVGWVSGNAAHTLSVHVASPTN
jgi:hypothetical protein